MTHMLNCTESEPLCFLYLLVVKMNGPVLLDITVLESIQEDRLVSYHSPPSEV